MKYNNSNGADNTLDKTDSGQTEGFNKGDVRVNRGIKNPDTENPENEVLNTDLSEPEFFSDAQQKREKNH